MVAPPSLPLSFVQWGEWFEELLMAPSPWVVLLMVGHAHSMFQVWCMVSPVFCVS
jgi:hypothetical protein